MSVLIPSNATAPTLQTDPGVQDHLVASGEYDGALPFKSRFLYAGVTGHVRLWLWGNPGIAASGQILFGSISGNVGAEINGVAVTVDAGDYDTATEAATALAAAINASADAAHAGLVYASNTTPLTYPAIYGLQPDQGGAAQAGPVVTVWWHNPSPAGDAITLVADGTGVTVSGATLDGADGTTLYKNIAAGVDLKRRVRQIIASGTTATDLVIVR